MKHFYNRNNKMHVYQTWQTHFWGNSQGVQRHVVFSFLIVFFGC